MATDKKSQHVGNHGGGYTDINGMSKQFTYIDHDKKTKISTAKEENPEQIKRAIKDHTYKAIRAILSMPAVNVVRNPDDLYEEFVIRDPEKGVIWNDTMVFDACSINDILRYNMFNQVWKATVKMQYWSEDMSYDDIIAGEWKKWS
jgi:hypothetical protein